METFERTSLYATERPAFGSVSGNLTESWEPISAIEGLARLEAVCASSNLSAFERARALVERVAELIDDADLLRGTALFPLLRSQAVDASAGEEVLGDAAVTTASELVRIDELGATLWHWDFTQSAGQAEALRKMLFAAFKDPRLLLVKLADQVLELRARKDGPPEERERVARETREIYAPLANRLGVWQLKWELEDLAFRYLEPENYQRVARWLAEKRVDRERYIASVIAQVEAELARAQIRAEVTGRPKHIYSIWRKIHRKGLSFEQIMDVRAIRILVDTVADCYAALGVVHGLWPNIPGEFDDYIAKPKKNLYRSLHTAVIGPENLPVEVQIRTREMHEEAELGVAAHWRYKEGGRQDPAYARKIALFRQLLEPTQDESPEDLLDTLRAELFEGQVYVLSPRGEIVELPRGATALDYAYQIHTDLGHRCRGAKVNGRLVPLTQPLRNGDQVEILASKHPSPSRDWLVPSLGYLAMSRNRAKVRAWFRKLDEAQNQAHGRQILERELERLGVRNVTLPELIADFRCETAEQLYQAIGEGEISAAQIAGAVQRRLKPVADVAAASHRAGTEVDTRAAVRIDGVGSIQSTFARCCNPVPLEPVVGYITVGRGMTVHKQSCASFLRLAEKSPERVMVVEWSTQPRHTFPVEIRVRAHDRPGLVRDISSVLADANINIETMGTSTNERAGLADITLRIAVHSLEDLSRILARIKGIPSVLEAERRTSNGLAPSRRHARARPSASGSRAKPRSRPSRRRT